MTIDSKFIIKFAAVLTALGTIGYTGWTVGNATGLRPWLKFEQDAFTAKEFKLVMDGVEVLYKANAKAEFNEIEDLLKRGVKLSWEQKRDFCTNAHILNYPVEGSYGLTCTRDGQPDLVEKVSP